MGLSKADLEAQNETNLLGLMSNSQVEDQTRLFAAVLLYKRGSRFLAFEEWLPWKTRVLDYLLHEQSLTPVHPFAPNIGADLAGRLHTRLLSTADSTSQAHTKISETRVDLREEFLRGLADHDQELASQKKNFESKILSTIRVVDDNRDEANDKIQILDTGHSSLSTSIKKLKTLVYCVGAVSLVCSYLIHHFLR